MACDGETSEDDAAAAAAGGVGSGGDGGGVPSVFPDGFVDLGSIATLPVNALVTIPSHELLLGRDEGGVYAMTSRCTHRNCNMIANEGITPGNITVCGCHGSNFDPNGVPINGPASQPLAHFEVMVNEAIHVGVNLDVEVDIDERAEFIS